MSAPHRPPTIKDVARVAGVSPSTVSHAFSGRRTISAITRERVLRAADALGYHPNPHAQSMRTGRSGIIGLILRPQVSKDGSLESHETFNRLAGAVAVACIREGLGLVHIPTPKSTQIPVLPMDGCIVAYPNANDSVIDMLMSRRVPLVCADPDPSRPDISATVGVDYEAGITSLLGTLSVEAGDDVWLMVGSESNAWTLYSEKYMQSWADREGVTLMIHRAQGYMSHTEAREMFAELLRTSRSPRAIVYGRSDLTESAVSAISGANLRIPHDVQLATLTDSVHTQILLRSVTALDLNQEALAQAAVTLMLKVLEDPQQRPEPVVVAPRLRVRGSTMNR